VEIPNEESADGQTLWGYVDGSERLGSSEEARSTFRRKTQKAFSSIGLSVSTSHLYSITSCEKPKEACDALRKHLDGFSWLKVILEKAIFFVRRCRKAHIWSNVLNT
jgi:hypothetical protein